MNSNKNVLVDIPISSLKPNALLLLMGLPASGKTTLAQHILADSRFKTLFPKIIKIDPDTIRAKLTGNHFDPTRENDVIIEKFRQIRTVLQPNTLVIVDDLHYLTSMRQDCRKIAHHMQAVYLSVYIQTSLDHCLARNIVRHEPIPNHVIEKIAEEFEIPGKKYAWDHADLTFNPIANTVLPFLDKLYTTLLNKLNNYEQELLQISEHLDEMKEITAGNTLEMSIDLSSRALLRQIIRKNVKSSDLQLLYQKWGLSASQIDLIPVLAEKFTAKRKLYVNWLLQKGYSEATLHNFFLFLELINHSHDDSNYIHENGNRV